MFPLITVRPSRPRVRMNVPQTPSDYHLPMSAVLLCTPARWTTVYALWLFKEVHGTAISGPLPSQKGYLLRILSSSEHVPHFGAMLLLGNALSTTRRYSIREARKHIVNIFQIIVITLICSRIHVSYITIYEKKANEVPN